MFCRSLPLICVAISSMRESVLMANLICSSESSLPHPSYRSAYHGHGGLLRPRCSSAMPNANPASAFILPCPPERGEIGQGRPGVLLAPVLFFAHCTYFRVGVLSSRRSRRRPPSRGSFLHSSLRPLSLHYHLKTWRTTSIREQGCVTVVLVYV